MTEIAEARMCIRLGCPLRGEMTQEERCPSCNHFTEAWREQPRAASTVGNIPVGAGTPGPPAPVGRPRRRSALKTLRYVRLGVILILIVAGLIVAQIAKSDARKGAQPINAGNPGGPTAAQPTAQPTQATQPTQTTEPTTAAFPASDQYGPIDHSKCSVTVPTLTALPMYAQLNSYLIAVDQAVAAGVKTRNVDCLSKIMADGTPSAILFDQPAQPNLAVSSLEVSLDLYGQGSVSNPDPATIAYSGHELAFGYDDQNNQAVKLYGVVGPGTHGWGMFYIDTTDHSHMYDNS